MASIHEQIALLHSSHDEASLQAACDAADLDLPLWARSKLNREIAKKNLSLGTAASRVGDAYAINTLAVSSRGSLYAPGEMITLSGGTLDPIGSAAIAKVITTTVASVSLNLTYSALPSYYAFGNVNITINFPGHSIPATGGAVSITGASGAATPIPNGVYIATYVSASSFTIDRTGSGGTVTGVGQIAFCPICLASPAGAGFAGSRATTGSGTRAIITYSFVSSGAVTGVSFGFASYRGSYTINPTDLSNEPLVLTTLQGVPLTVTMTMGAGSVTAVNGGLYADEGTTTFSQASSSGSGSGVSLSASKFTNCAIL